MPHHPTFRISVPVLAKANGMDTDALYGALRKDPEAPQILAVTKARQTVDVREFLLWLETKAATPDIASPEPTR